LSRQPLWRRVNFLPQSTFFKPTGVPLARLQEVRLSIEEAEAIRLKDLEGLEQEECAKKMNISRSTFARELNLGRQKVADALINGKAIRINGGNFEMTKRRFRCVNGHEWDMPFELITNTPTLSCPTCNTPTIMPVWPLEPGRGGVGHGSRHRRGRNW
jgi:predicted DNA-binding protein (UPF0251 family)